MKLKFRTEKDCFHNGRYYEAGSIVECDCKFCKEGSVSYFKKVDDKGEVIEEENVPQETITDEKEVAEETPKKKPKTKIQITE